MSLETVPRRLEDRPAPRVAPHLHLVLDYLAPATTRVTGGGIRAGAFAVQFSPGICPKFLYTEMARIES
jgi:hypothetical protein